MESLRYSMQRGILFSREYKRPDRLVLSGDSPGWLQHEPTLSYLAWLIYVDEDANGLNPSSV